MIHLKYPGGYILSVETQQKNISSIPGGKNMEYGRIPVECRSGYKVNEYPVAFTFQGRRWEVSEIMDRWYEGGIKSERPVMDYFKVITPEGRVFVLIYAGHLDAWFIRY